MGFKVSLIHFLLVPLTSLKKFRPDSFFFFFWSKYFCVVFILVSWCSVLFGSSVVLNLSYFHMETISHTQAYHFLYAYDVGSEDTDTLKKGCLFVIKVVVGDVQSLNRVQLFVTLWSWACQASLSLTISPSSPSHVHWISDAIQPSHPLLSPSPALNLFQHQGLFQWVGWRLEKRYSFNKE